MSGLGGLNKAPDGVVIGLVQIQNPVVVTPEEFAHWKSLGLSLGLGVVESGPLVRSSYHADEQSQKYTGEEHLNRTNALAGT